MRGVLILLFIFAGLTGRALAECKAGDASSSGPGSALLQAAHPIGGALFSRSGALSLEWPGSGVEFIANGDVVTLTVENGGINRLRIDIGSEVKIVELEWGRQRLEFNLPTGGSTKVRVRRLTGRTSGSLLLHAIEPQEAIRSTQEYPRRIIVIGDSISVGYGVDGEGPECGFSHLTVNQSLTYSALAADAVGAELTTVAISGIGLIRNYAGGPGAPMREVWAENVNRIGCKPDLIIVALGTNDFSTQHDPGAPFEEAYLRFLMDLRSEYPTARLLAAAGPMHDGEVGTGLSGAVFRSVARFNSSGDPLGAEAIIFSNAEQGRIYGCHWHPGRDTHAKMARDLVAWMETSLGWRITQHP